MEDQQPIVKLDNIAFGYPGGTPILKELSLAVYPKERIGLLGPNGSGKTTLFFIIMGLLRPTAGTVEVFGSRLWEEKDFSDIYRKIGLLFQDADDQLFCPTVLEDVAFGPLNMGKSRKESIEIARSTLADLGLEGFEDRITHRLSGGEKRFVSLATVLAMEPEMLLLDEPTTGLDARTRERLMDRLAQLDIAYLLISHEMDFLADTTDKVHAMEGGKILTDTTVKLHQHVHAHIHGSHPHEHK